MSIRLQLLASYRTDFNEILCLWIFFSKICRQSWSFITFLQGWTSTWHVDPCSFLIVLISRWAFRRMRSVSDKIRRDNQDRHFVFSSFFRKLCCLWGNVERCGTAWQPTDGNTKRRMRIACWITKTTDTHSEYVIPTDFSTAKVVMRTQSTVTCIHTVPGLLPREPWLVSLVLTFWAIMYLNQQEAQSSCN